MLFIERNKHEPALSIFKRSVKVKYAGSLLCSTGGKSPIRKAPVLLEPSYFCENRPDLACQGLLWGEGEGKGQNNTLKKHQFKKLMHIELRKSVLFSSVACN